MAAKKQKRAKRLHKCEYCGRKNRTVKHQEDPYESDLYADRTKHWICDECCTDRANDL